MTALVGGPTLAADVNTLADRTTGAPLVRLIQQTAQTALAISSDTVLTFGASSEDIDTHSYHDTTTNTSRITPTIGHAAYYRVEVKPVMASSTTITSMNTFFRKNGTIVERSGNMRPASVAVSQASTPLVAFLTLNGTTDYVEGGVHFEGSATQATNVVAGSASVLQLEYLRPV